MRSRGSEGERADSMVTPAWSSSGLHELEKLLDDMIQIAVLEDGVHGLHREEEVHDDPIETIHLLADDRQMRGDVLGLDALLAGNLLLDELQVDPHGSQRVLYLVRHSRGKRREGGEALRPPQTRLLGAFFRHILDVRDAAFHAAPAHQRQQAHRKNPRRRAVNGELLVVHLFLIAQIVGEEVGQLPIRDAVPEELVHEVLEGEREACARRIC